MDRIKLRDELTRDEGLRLESYKDTVGLWTIGVGHLLGTERRMISITMAEAMALLDADIMEAKATALKAIGGDEFVWDLLGDVRQRVLVNMAFNLGPRLFQFKNTLAMFVKGDWDGAAANMLLSKWAKQVGQRAIRLSNMTKTGMA